MLVQCRATVYDVGPTLNQHRSNDSCLLWPPRSPHKSVMASLNVMPAGTRISPCAALMLAQRRRCWPSIEAAQGERLVCLNPLHFLRLT